MKDFMERLLDNEVHLKYRSLTEMTKISKDASEIVAKALVDQFIPSESDGRALRLSSLGKLCEIELAARYFEIIPSYTPPDSLRIKRLMFDGLVFESDLYFEMEMVGYRVLDTQHELAWKGIKGHPDFIVSDANGQLWVVDAKTSNDYYFNNAVKNGIYDERGYMTQLAAYSEASGQPACLVLKNKDTSEIATFFMDGEIHRHKNAKGTPVEVNVTCPNPDYPDVVKVKLEHLEGFLSHLINGTISGFDDVFRYYDPPMPNIEMRFTYDNGRKVGEEPVMVDGLPKFYPSSNISCPELMYYLYEGSTSYGKKRMYISGYKYPLTYEEGPVPNIMDAYYLWCDENNTD